jgi:hypothetical protein
MATNEHGGELPLVIIQTSLNQTTPVTTTNSKTHTQQPMMWAGSTVL